MDVYEIRKHNLLLLEAEHASLKAIGDAMVRVVQRRDQGERAPDYPNVLSQHKGKKPMGPKIARLIEDAVGKPRGWMDALRAGDEAMESKEAAQIAMNIADADLRELWLSTGRAYAARGAQPSQAAPFAGVRRGGKKPPDGAQ